MARILVVDDNAQTREVVQRMLQNEGHTVCTAADIRRAAACLRDAASDLVITDQKMPGGDGQELVRHIRDNHPETAVMMITGYPSIPGAVDAVKLGAGEYLAKPFTDAELLAAVARVLAAAAQRQTAQADPAPVPAGGLLGSSPALAKVRAAVTRAAAASATVLITGESGTGKELVARAIHYQSARATAPFIPVNCSAIPEPLLESELFGHRRGAFTGATHDRAGFFQAAEGGTLFLDEIGDTPPAMQAKLLRVLQDGELLTVGADRPRRVDVRVIAATNQDLAAQQQQQRFRDDLYYRLAVITIAVPPLRERGDDVLLLARHYLARYAQAAGRPVPVFDAAAVAMLAAYAWPGNVRELENLMHRLAVMHDGETIVPSDLPEAMRFTLRSGGDWQRSLAAVEAEHIARVLAATGGNRTRAAAVLGIDRKTLRLKLSAGRPPAAD